MSMLQVAEGKGRGGKQGGAMACGRPKHNFEAHCREQVCLQTCLRILTYYEIKTVKFVCSESHSQMRPLCTPLCRLLQESVEKLQSKASPENDATIAKLEGEIM